MRQLNVRVALTSRRHPQKKSLKSTDADRSKRTRSVGNFSSKNIVSANYFGAFWSELTQFTAIGDSLSVGLLKSVVGLYEERLLMH